MVERYNKTTLAFGCNLGLAEPRQELDALAAVAIRLYRGPQAPWTQEQPLRVLIEREGEELRFRLDEESAARVRAAKGVPVVVSLHRDVAASFRAEHGRLYPHLPEVLTRLSRERVLELGGVRFYEGETKVFEWPARV